MEHTTLARARQRLSLSLREVAAELGVSRASVSRWERGLAKPQPTLLRKLCLLYHISPGDLNEHLPVAAENVPVEADIVRTFQAQDLTICLLDLIWNHQPRSGHQALQQMILLKLHMYQEEPTMQEAINRRDALRRIAVMPLLLATSTRTEAASAHADELIKQCAAGVTACVALSKQKELAFVSHTLDRYISSLVEITKSGNAAQRTAAADVLAQCLLLHSIQAKHVTTSMDAIRYALQAERYSTLANNPLLQIAALCRQSGAHYYASNYEQALTLDDKAESVFKGTARSGKIALPPIIASCVYAGRSIDLAMHGQRQEALKALQQAHTTFYAQPSNEPLPVWVHHNLTSLTLTDGLTHLNLNQHKEAAQAFMHVTTLPAASASSKVEATINLVMTELIREDRERDMEYCITKWTEGIEGAKTLKSQQLFSESVQAYTAMRAAWPTEQRVKALKELIVHW